MLLFSDDVRTTVEGESIARSTYSVILFSLLLALVFSMLNHRHRNKKKEEREKKNLPDVFISLGRKKREKENERNMHN
jgi:preprotein translocase subunit SecG